MSYRDLRNFTEMMRVLSYPRLISMENFRTPNFPLVAEILVWLVERIDPNVSMASEIAEEDDRVHLIRTATHVLALKVGLKLNPKKLYQADGYAVRELLKVASLLYNSLKQVDLTNEDSGIISMMDAVLKIQEAPNARKMVADITANGAALFDLLGQEVELRQIRHARASRPLEINEVEVAVRDGIQAVSKDISRTKDMINSSGANEASLDSKIEKKQSDLDRHTKRLQSLRKMRPAFMDEFEKLEEELKTLYDEYVVKARNISYLEHALEQLEQIEEDRRIMKQTSARNVIEDVKIESSLRPLTDAGEDMERKTAGVVRGSAAKGVRKSFGSMSGGFDDTETLDDSDSDLLLDGDLTEDDEEPKSLKDLSEDDF